MAEVFRSAGRVRSAVGAVAVVVPVAVVAAGSPCFLVLEACCESGVFRVMLGCDICGFNLMLSGSNDPNNLFSCGIDFCCTSAAAGLEPASLGAEAATTPSCCCCWLGLDGPARSNGSTNPPGTGTGNAVGGACLMCGLDGF